MTSASPGPPEQPDPPSESTQPSAPSQRKTQGALRRTRTSITWIGIIVFAVVLVLLLIFILQNTESVHISYLGANGHIPLSVAMLLSAVAGVLLAAIAGSLRIWQLRRHLRRSDRG